jgi:lipoprotein-anchoring transpeptidase ErfK/SrfK
LAKRKKTKRRPARKRSKKSVRRWKFLTAWLLGVSLIAGLIWALVYFWPNDFPFRQKTPTRLGRAIANTTELQIALARTGFSPGSIDGVTGEQTRLALLAYQHVNDLPLTGLLDLSTAEQLLIEDPVYVKLELTEKDFQKIAPKPQSWIERGLLDAMRYNSILEMVAEHTQSDPDYIAQINPSIEWNQLQAGAHLIVPNIHPYRISGAIASVHIQLASRTLEAYDAQGRLSFHCPVSIARRVDKRPSGELAVKVRVKDPNYTFNPAILKATATREGINEKFIIQPGPNNPVGKVWIGLNLPSYGIHGTPEPEKVGRTESSGCFRLANWNAETLLDATWVGMPIYIDP